MKLLFYSFAILSLFACSQPANHPATNTLPTTDTSLSIPQPAPAATIEGYYQPAGDSVILPAFSVLLHLSTKAEAELKQLNETIMVSATFEGRPKDTMDSFFQQWGYIVVGNGQVELKADRTATFSRITISKAGYDSLVSKDVDVLIDVFSGRHSTQNNLLDCEFLQAPISKVRQQVNVLSGKLIGE